MGLRYGFGVDTQTVAGTDPGYAFFASNSPTIERQEPTEAGLIDAYRLYLRPVVLGGGSPFFAGPRPPLHLVASDLIADDLIRLTYVPA